jgi:hypothetical protein
MHGLVTLRPEMAKRWQTQGKAIDHRQLGRVWDYYRTNTSVRACVNVLRSCILSGGLVTRSGSLPDPVLERHCKRILNHALDWGLVAGVIPVTRGVIQTSEGSRTKVPIVPDNSFINLSVKMDEETGQRCYTAQRRAPVAAHTSGTRNIRKTVLVWDTGQSTPLSNGEIATDLATLASSEILLAIHRKHEMIANAARCNPVLVTQATKRTNSDMGGVNWLQPDDIYEESEQARLAALDKVSGRQASQNFVETNSVLGSLVGHVHPADTTPREFPLSAERELVRPAMPEAPTRLATMEAVVHKRCLQLLGIPEAVFEATGQSQNGQLQRHLLAGTVNRWRNVLQEFLDGALAMANPTGTQFDIEPVPCIALDEMHNLYEAGIIPLETYQRTLHHTLGTQQAAKRKKPNQPRAKTAQPRPAPDEDKLE